MNNLPRYTALSALTLVFLSACATPAVPSSQQIELRNRFSALQSDPVLGRYAQQSFADAESALILAEQPQSSVELSAHNEFVAHLKIDIAEVKAREAYLLERQQNMSRDTANARLVSRTAEADRANRRATELGDELAAMNAKPSPRGMLVTLGDVLFPTGQSNLSPGADSNLGKLFEFMTNNPESRLAIEGHTDSMGSQQSNIALSESRASAVSTYLQNKGVSQKRMTVQGFGEASPVASNDSASGRQLNRRVEVTILNP